MATVTKSRQKKVDRRCVTCNCKMSIYNTEIQCKPCQKSRPLGGFEKERLAEQVKAAEEAREAQRRFLREQDEMEKREGDQRPEEIE